MDSRHILIIHRYFWPENISETPYLLKTIAEMHLQRGDRVTIAAGASKDFTAEWAEALPAGIDIKHFRAPNDRGMPVYRKLLSLLQLLWLGTRTLASGRFDLVYTISYPPGFSAVIILLSRVFQRRASLVYYVQDILSYRISSTFLRKIYRATSGWTIAKANRTITLSPAMKQELGRHLPKADAGRIEVIPNCFAFDGQTAVIAEPRRDIIYAGAHGKSQNLHHFLSAIEAMPADQRPTVALFGEGDDKASLLQRVADKGLSDCVTFNNPIPRARIMDEICTARYGLVGAVPGLMNYAFPSKIGNYTSAGTPVLVMCEGDSPMASWLGANGFGATIDPGDVDKAAADLGAALALRGETRQASSARLQKAAQQVFGVSGYRASLTEVIDPLLGHSADEFATGE